MESNIKEKQEFFLIEEKRKVKNIGEKKKPQKEEEYAVNINDSILNNNKSDTETNAISTSKYNFFNCIPIIIIEQFSKMANCYFLMIAIMQVIYF